MADLDATVVVVGAGLAGLTAADRLQTAGADVLVVEARDRVGGRTWSREVDGAILDVGGQWIGPAQTRMVALAERFDLATFPTYGQGRHLIDLDGTPRSYRGTIPRMHPIALVQAQALLTMLNREVRATNPGRPWARAGAADLDGVTVADWLRRRRAHRDVVASLAAGLRVVFGVELDELPALQLLAYASAAGGLMPLLETRGGAQDRRLVRGTQQFSVRLAQGLRRPVELDAPVTAVRVDGEGADRVVEVVSTQGRSWTCRRVVLALPTNLTVDLAFEPALPPARARRLAGAPMGTTTKYLVTYARPFWRDQGLSGEAVASRGPLSVVFDNTSWDGAVPGLVAFSVAQPGRDHAELPEQQRRAAVLDQLTHLFGPPAAAPRSFVEQQWGLEEWTGGCPVAIPSLGVTTATADDWMPVGPLHFAGTETASEWRGFLEGAVQSGERAAAEIAAALRLPTGVA